MHRVLYLIGIGICEEEQQKQQQQSPEQPPFQFTAKAAEVGLVESLEALAGSPRIESHRELLAWITRRLKHALGILETDEMNKGRRGKGGGIRRFATESPDPDPGFNSYLI